MKKGIAAFMALVLAAGAGAGVYYQFLYRNRDNYDAGRVSSDSEDAVFVDSVSMLAGIGTGSGMVTRYAGVVEPEETWSAKTESDKSIAKTYVKEGDEVKVGDLLFTYDTSDDQEKLEQSKIDIERRENEIATTKVALEKAKKDEAKAPQEEKLDFNTTILEYELQIKSNENENIAAQRENEQLEEAIRSADVVSELDGIVKSIKSQDSSNSYYDGDSSENYITIMSVGSYRVKALINEQHINDISEGESMIAFSRVDGTTWEGTIVEINTEKGESNQQDSYYMGGDDSSDNGSATNYPFYVELEDSEGLILGQHVYLEPDVGQTQAKDGIWIPDYYFEIEENGTAWAWAASPRNLLEHRQVKLGEHDDEMMTYEVLEGLDEDDYITAPVEDLTEGLPVSYIDYSDAGSEDVYGDDLYFDDGSYDDEDLYFDDGSYFLEYDEGSNDDLYWDEDDEDWDDEDWDDEDWDDEDWGDEDFVDEDAEDPDGADGWVQDEDAEDPDGADGLVQDEDAEEADNSSPKVTTGTVLSGHSYKKKEEEVILGDNDLRKVGEADGVDGWVVDLGDDG